MMDLGGGSCELTVTQGGHIRDAVSLPLGAVRLSNEFLRHDPTAQRRTEAAARICGARSESHRDRIGNAKVKNVIATSGTAAALAAVASHLRRSAGRPRPVVSRAEMSRIAKRLARLPVAERRKIEGIGPRRAEIIVAGATVYHELLDRLHLKSFRYSPLGLRDGILAQMAADYDRSTRSGRQIESERWESIMKAVDHYNVDRKHALTCGMRPRRYSRAAFGASAAAGISRVAHGRGHAV
jgi:exopolyphosphatase / guanosine-5'-triphosphate,3'-diphosphate pyrophosphatase